MYSKKTVKALRLLVACKALIFAFPPFVAIFML